MQSESICTSDLEGFSTDSTLIPVELLACDVSSHTRSQDNFSIVELGKQLLQNARNGDTESVRELMCRGAPFTTDWLGTSALHLAALHNHIETAEVLLRAGISRDSRTKVDRTPLHMAAYEGHHLMVQLLLNYGADVDSRDMLKMTPLHWAVEREHIEVMHVLLDHGADIGATSKFNKTPISLALEHDRLDLVDILQQEREIIDIQAQQQSQANSAELEVATHNLVQLEAENKNSITVDTLMQPQQSQQLRKRRYSQLQVEKKQNLIFQHIPASSNDLDDKQVIEDIETNIMRKLPKHKDVMSLEGKQFRLLEAHGIRMIPVDDESSIVENAMESGRTVVLTEAGKLALNLTKGTPIQHLQVASQKGTAKKVLIRTDKIQSKILNQNSNTVTRSPNILKKSAIDNKTAKLILATIPNTTTVSNIAEIKNVQAKAKIVTSPTQSLPILQLDNDIEEVFEENSEPITDVAILSRQLEEARKQAAEYRKQLQEKEKEAEIYKQQLKDITAHIASK